MTHRLPHRLQYWIKTASWVIYCLSQGAREGKGEGAPIAYVCCELGLMRFPQAALEMNLLKVFFSSYCVKRCKILEKLSLAH